MSTGKTTQDVINHYAGGGDVPAWTVETPSGNWTRNIQGAAVFSLFAIYSAQIVVKEAIEDHISTSRSWFASVVIGGLALLAAWQATRLWRKASETRRPDREDI